jgi:hypothetical protein
MNIVYIWSRNRQLNDLIHGDDDDDDDDDDDVDD